MTLTIKQNDTYPAIKFTLEQFTAAWLEGIAAGKTPAELTKEKVKEKEPINLTGAKEVSLVLKASGSPIEGKTTITSAAKGEGEWFPTEAFTKTAGTYQVEAKIEWGSGQYQTVPNEGYDTIVIQAFLGEAH